VLSVLGAVVGVALFYAFILRDLPEIQSLDDYRPRVITHVYAEDGAQVAALSKEQRIVVEIEELPQHVTQAFVAAEDGSFYKHEGLDYPGIVRAFWKNLLAGRTVQGGSTITQQVAKTFLLSSERSYVRKLKDMVLARRIEQGLDKNQILYLYLNQIYLGSGAYGIEAAAQTYFGKPASELGLAEAALIAGVVPRPSRWSPLVDRETAEARGRVVLRRMHEDRFIDDQQLEAALAEPLEYADPEWSERDAAVQYFVEEVRRYLVGRYGSDYVLTEGLQVHTSLDVERQIAAYQAVRRGLRNHDRRQGWRGPIRNVPEEERAAALEELAIFNEEQRPGEIWLHRGMIAAIDAEKQEIRLALGPGRETALPLEAVDWVRPLDPKLDGTRVKRKSVDGTNLALGDVVQLEVVGVDQPEDPLTDEPPVYSYALYQEPRAEGALVAIDLADESLAALVGGYSFTRSEFNRALQSRRQPGSAFKPVVYASAIEGGYTPATIIYDTAKVYRDESSGFVWKPRNYSKEFYGPITLRWALAKSRNAATIEVAEDIGIERVVQTARRLGIASPLEKNLGLALGNSGVTLTELVRAYTTFAAQGRLIDPIFIREIRDRRGDLIEENVKLVASQATAEAPDVAEGEAPSEDPFELREAARSVEEIMSALREGNGHEELGEGPALDPASAYLMTDLLRAVVQEGTGRRVRALGRPVAGKTGTTNDLNDAWFIGFTPQYAAGAWVGYDDMQDLGRNETGSRAASPIFLDFMLRAHRGLPVRDFEAPPGIVFVGIDKDSGLLPCGVDQDVLFQPFREGSAPSESCTGSAPGSTNAGGAGPLRLD
jgi:penicillin-binding protein 1A